MTPDAFKAEMQREAQRQKATVYFFWERTMNPDDPTSSTLTAAWNKIGRIRLFDLGDWWVLRAYRPDDTTIAGTAFIPAEFAEVAQPDHIVTEQPLRDAVRHLFDGPLRP